MWHKRLETKTRRHLESAFLCKYENCCCSRDGERGTAFRRCADSAVVPGGRSRRYDSGRTKYGCPAIHFALFFRILLEDCIVRVESCIDLKLEYILLFQSNAVRLLHTEHPRTLTRRSQILRLWVKPLIPCTFLNVPRALWPGSELFLYRNLLSHSLLLDHNNTSNRILKVGLHPLPGLFSLILPALS